jgi:ureidoacrylate peracid hydrolase
MLGFDKKLINPKKTAVLVIDIQNDYCSEKGKIAKLRKFDMTPILKIIPKISKFLDVARAVKMPIIWTRMIEDPKYMKKNAAQRILSSPKPLILCTPGTSGFDYYKIRPKKGDKEVIKRHYDSFSNPKLQKTLQKMKIKNLIILGVYTSVCVDSTIRSAHRLDYNVILPKDMVAMPVERWHLHKAALENLEMIFAYTTTSDELMNVLIKKKVI